MGGDIMRISAGTVTIRGCQLLADRDILLFYEPGGHIDLEFVDNLSTSTAHGSGLRVGDAGSGRLTLHGHNNRFPLGGGPFVDPQSVPANVTGGLMPFAGVGQTLAAANTIVLGAGASIYHVSGTAQIDRIYMVQSINTRITELFTGPFHLIADGAGRWAQPAT